MASFTDLNDEDFFPPWEHLPGHVYLDGPSPFYHSEDNGGDSRSGTGHRYTPKRHWCFLGEIESYERFMRCRTVVKDDFDRKYIIAFYLDDSNAFDSSKLREGHTMAVMYAHQHAFADGTCGVRVENPDYVRIFPIGHQELEWLSTAMQEYGKPTDGKWKCHGCDKLVDAGSE